MHVSYNIFFGISFEIYRKIKKFYGYKKNEEIQIYNFSKKKNELAMIKNLKRKRYDQFERRIPRKHQSPIKDAAPITSVDKTGENSPKKKPTQPKKTLPHTHTHTPIT